MSNQIYRKPGLINHWFYQPMTPTGGATCGAEG
jgi:hypothetical protein